MNDRPIEAATLHQQILNLKYEQGFSQSTQPRDWRDGYTVGHRDARHAAAALVLASAPIEAAQTSGMVALLSNPKFRMSGGSAFALDIIAALASAPPAAATVPEDEKALVWAIANVVTGVTRGYGAEREPVIGAEAAKRVIAMVRAAAT